LHNIFHLHLREMLEFVRWGDQLAQQAARSVPDDAYHKDFGISSGSLHKLLTHCMAVQWLWACRMQGESPARLEDQSDYRSRLDVEQRWPLVHAVLIEFVGRQSTSALQHAITYRDTRGESHTMQLGQTILHVIDHASYHRGQINTLIRRAGGTPVPISYRLWCAEKARHR
jgi:uncharacterized damage-inducible protein DinB